MPDQTPAPITPEGKRAAERIRTIFYSIAAANIVLVAIVIWHRQAHKEPSDAPPNPVATEDAAAKRAQENGKQHDSTDEACGTGAKGK